MIVLKKCFKRLLFGVLVGCCFNSFAVAQKQYYNWDFSDCDLKDILYAVSLDTGISIVPDDTVSGKGDLKFAGKDFSAAFEAFLKSSRLYVVKGENFWTVSRFYGHKENGFYYVDVYDLTPVQIVEKLSGIVEKVLTFDALPGQKISLHFKDVTEVTLIESLCKRFGNYEAIKNEYGYHFSKKSDLRKMDFSDGYSIVETVNDCFFIDVRNCLFEEVIEKLFEVKKMHGEEKNFCLLTSGDIRVSRASYFSADFDDALEKLCWQSGFSFVQEDGVFYIYADANAKSSLLKGKKYWKKFSFNYITTQDFFPILSKRLEKIETVELGGKTAFLGCINENEEKIINQLISEVDIKQSTYLITLKYVKPAELIEHLPPSVDKNNLSIADDTKSLYFKGTEKAYENLLMQLELCDRPEQRITYDLLIIQYDETEQNLWSSNFDCKRLMANSKNNISAVLGSVAGLNLNVISAFGLNFAAELQNSIEENNAKVFADTTLHGISGKPISFQNTNTYRYRDNNVNQETGAPVYSGVTREISSGIKLDICGWVSGEGLITSKVTASVSRQGNDTSASTGNPPPTSEKIVTTEVCGKNGEPVILSGLVLSADSNQEKRTPLISKIPVLGYLFKNKSVIHEKTQMVIYLVPRIESLAEVNESKNDFDDLWVKNRIRNFKQKLYKKEDMNE